MRPRKGARTDAGLDLVLPAGRRPVLLGRARGDRPGGDALPLVAIRPKPDRLLRARALYAGPLSRRPLSLKLLGHLAEAVGVCSSSEAKGGGMRNTGRGMAC